MYDNDDDDFDLRYPVISNPELNGKSYVFGSKLETFPNPNFLEIHTRAPLCKKNQWYSDHFDEDLKDFSILTTALIRGLESILGITEVSIRQYRISILRSPAYSWEEILKKALPIFVSYLPATY